MTPVRLSSMGPGTITAFAALLGSLVGALGSSLSTWITQRHEGRRDLLAKKIFHREELYSDFITESAHLLADALQHNVADVKNLIPVYGLLSRMRLSSSPAVLAKAEELVSHVVAIYGEPNRTPAQIQAMATNMATSGEDPLKNFGEVCRAELESMQRQL